MEMAHQELNSKRRKPIKVQHFAMLMMYFEQALDEHEVRKEDQNELMEFLNFFEGNICTPEGGMQTIA